MKQNVVREDKWDGSPKFILSGFKNGTNPRKLDLAFIKHRQAKKGLEWRLMKQFVVLLVGRGRVGSWTHVLHVAGRRVTSMFREQSCRDFGCPPWRAIQRDQAEEERQSPRWGWWLESHKYCKDNLAMRVNQGCFGVCWVMRISWGEQVAE